VTGVQTCALPIFGKADSRAHHGSVAVVHSDAKDEFRGKLTGYVVKYFSEE
jgi:hypothetical protein